MTPQPFPLDKADQCVKCGLCLPHCPTYTYTQDEAESPRGRIALMQGLASGQLAATDKLQAHLDGCLSCRACESVCPAQVPYGELIDAVRANLQQARPKRNRSLRWLAFWLIGPKPRALLGLLLRATQASGLLTLAQTITAAVKPVARRMQFVPAMQKAPARSQYPAPPAVTPRGQVQLFTGCVSELFDGRTLQDAITCLHYLGFEVEVPAQQACCGALHQHNGMAASAQTLFASNLKAFGHSDTAILGTASGCTAMLAEYGLYADTAQAKHFSQRVSDVSAFLLQHWPQELAIADCNARALVQDPCTLRNVLGTSPAVYGLLNKIPGLEVAALDNNGHCCGAAGSMMFSHATQADALVGKKIKALQENPPDYLISSNIGCALHMQAALKRAGIKLEVLHPVSLLARQLRAASS